MIISRKSPVTGRVNHRVIDILPEQYLLWRGGKPIQDVMPDASLDDREFIMSGCTPSDFDYLFPEEK